MNREDFNMLDNDSDIVYLDNGATTLKPKILAEKTKEYYNNYSANSHRGDYDISLKVDTLYEYTRELVSKAINAEFSDEIIFTSGTTDSLNKIIFGYCKNHLSHSDEVLITRSEHASNILPWFELKDELGININYIELDNEHKITLENFRMALSEKTKIISIAHVTNVIGDARPIKEIIKLAHEKGIIVIIDGAQSIPHMKVDVRDLDIDFLAFSAHKMCGPTGVGVLYGKKELLLNTKPIIFGGGMNAYFESDSSREYSSLPNLLEAGTPNIAGIIGFGGIIEYLTRIGLDNIEKYESDLKEYAIKKLSSIDNLIIYNKNSEGPIITFNYDGIFAQDLSIYLNKYNICVRAGNHCAKILKEDLGIKNTCRVSLYFYNNKSDIDRLYDALCNPNIKNEII